jgi:hypothetical protein
MKKIYCFSLLLVSISFITSCEKKLAELNINRTAATAIDPVFQFNNAVVNVSFPSGTSLNYEMSIVQQLVTPNSGVLTGGNFNQDNRDNTQALWQSYYRNVIRNTRDVIERTKALPARSNLMNMARILQSMAFMILTDTYGNIPYSEAGLGYIDQKFLPKYDLQQDIYPKLITELTEASAALNASAPTETGEVLYGGNVAQWKKFGYSLLLRAGMRLSKVDAAKAQQVVQTAFAGGVILSNADNAYFRTTNDYQANLSGTLNSTEAANYYLAEPFVNFLKTTNDPRLPSIAIRYIGAKSGPEQTPAVGTTDAARQIGMPMGFDNGTIGAAVAARGLVSFYEFSQLDRRRMAKLTAPVYFVTAGQTNLLLAEAAQRGWITTGTAASYYTAGIRAHMEQLATYDAGSAVPASAIGEYLAANPLDPSRALEQINTQYWVASFLNGPEAWANFRRSGFPALAPNPYPGKTISGPFIRRLTYPNSEISVNPENLKAAVAAQGPDNLDTRVWWDK